MRSPRLRFRRIVAGGLALAFCAAATAAAAEEPLPPGSHFYDRYRAAAMAGDAKAQFTWALLLERGVTGQPDPAAAAAWYRQAAAQGHRDAQFKLGLLHQQGRGVAVDPQAAAQWYRAAAEQGQAEAQYNLGYLYETGQGVPRDLTQAIDLYRAAASGGVAAAMRNLGLLYAVGTAPLGRDDARAWFWLSLAAENGDTAAPALRDRVGRHMDDDTQMRAQALLKDWRSGG